MVYVHIVDTINSIYFYIYVFYPFNVFFYNFSDGNRAVFCAEFFIFAALSRRTAAGRPS